tara:strand:- start:413 stop:601 length:189 start_codon:yes stop_codon:yes gene_type:complete
MKDWFLTLNKEDKLKFVNDLYQEGKVMEAFYLVKILLDTPLDKGGVSTEEIKKILKPIQEWF